MKYILHFSPVPTVSTDTIPENRYIQYSLLKQILNHYLTERAVFMFMGPCIAILMSIIVQQDATTRSLFYL